jgi:glycolate oxidase FAD binding subunit
MDGGQSQFSIDGRNPQAISVPESVEQVSGTLHVANEQRRAVAPVGLGAFLHLGGTPRQYDLAVSLQRLKRVVDYQPTDMTVTVEAGISLAELQQVLGENGQWLPIDPPLAERATIGGIIAANLSGPARLSHGTIRDSLLGLKVVRTDGTVIKGGGRVVKNVAGYDVPKLFCGSLGTLGVIVEATFKVLPCPDAHAMLMLAFPSAQLAMDFALQVLGSELHPFFIELTNFSPAGVAEDHHPYRLFVRFAGIAEEVAYQRGRILEIKGEEGHVLGEWESSHEEPLIQTLRNFPVLGEAVLRCKTSLLPDKVATFCKEVESEASARGFSLQLLAHAGNGIIFSRFLHAELVPPETLLSFVDWLRILTKKLAGYLVIEYIDPSLKDRVDVWGHVGGTFPLMKRLKETFDPNGILNSGRFVGGI